MRQKGQSLVEFALMFPLLLMCILGLVYGGFAYADYLQYNNAVRDAARDIAVQEDRRQSIVDGLNSNSPAVVDNYVNPLSSLYKATFHADLNTDYVTVWVTFQRTNNVVVLPETLSTRPFTMHLER